MIIKSESQLLNGNDLILVIDKDPDISTIISYVLIEDGFNCVNYSGAFDAAYITDLNPVLIIVSHDTDDKTNEFCKNCKTHDQIRSIPVLITSTKANLEKIAENSYADAFLHKPFDIDKLSMVVSQTIEANAKKLFSY
ncbi:MAG: response regulator transcription factor [Pedobacter sp.]|nr:MAG: response regulator transcription factor [Pedobacter sp.]